MQKAKFAENDAEKANKTLSEAQESLKSIIDQLSKFASVFVHRKIH